MSMLNKFIGIVLAVTPLASLADDLGNRIYAQMVGTSPSQAAAEMRMAEGKPAPYLKAGNQTTLAKAIVEDCSTGKDAYSH